MDHRWGWRQVRAAAWLVLGWCSADIAAAREGSAEPRAEEPLEIIPVGVNNAPAPEALTREDDTVVLEEVVVTAQKVKQTLREVPASVTAISGEAMRDSKIVSPNDLNGYVPSTQMRISPFAGEIRIRGYGSSPSNVGFESSVGVVVDDVYYGRSAFLSSLFYDIDRLEVIRGPQGALFGKNTVAGVVNVTTVDADQYTAGDVTLSIRDDLKIRDLRGGVSVPLGDNAFTRVAGLSQSFEGLYYNTALDRNEADLDSNYGRVKLRFTDLMGTGAQLRLIGSTGSQKANGNLFQIAAASAASLALFREYDPDAEADATNDRLSSNVPSRIETTADTMQADLAIPLDHWIDIQSLSLNSISAYAKNDITARTIDFDFSPIPVVRLELADPSPYDQTSQEFRLAGRANSLFGLFGRTDFVLGAYYLQSHLISSDRVLVEDLGAAAAFVAVTRLEGAATGVSGAPLSDSASQALAQLLATVVQTPIDDLLLQSLLNREQAELLLDQDQQSISGYGQITTYVLDPLAVILGLRIGQEKKEARMVSEAPDGAIFIPAILGQANHDSYRSRKENETSPKAGLKYDFSKNVSAYGIWARGFKGGGFNALPFNEDGLEFDPEEANTFEVGLKARLLDGTLDANFAVYQTDFENLQVAVFSGTTAQVLNAAAARSQGFEADFRWLSPFPGTLVRGTLGYNDAKYTEYPNAPSPAGADTDDPGMKPCDDAPDVACQDLAGRSLANAPKWSASLIPQLSVPGFSEGWGLQFSVEALYTDERYLDVDLDPRVLQDATLIFNGRVSIGSTTGNWSFSVLATNFTEEEFVSQKSDQPVAPGNFGAIRGSRGREFFGVIKLNF